MSLDLVPITLKEANAFVEQYHRHHGPVVGHKFSIACSDGEKTVGVAIVGRPVSRHLDDGWTLEVTRLCTDGTRNACSMLYSAAWRCARAMGYKRLVTYILETENGASLRASGWKCVGQAGGLRWTGKRRPRVDLCPAQMKLRFERTKGETDGTTDLSYTTVADIQKSLGGALEQLLVSVCALGDAAGIAPKGSYEAAFKWDDSIITDKDQRRKELYQLAIAGKFPLWRYYVECLGFTEKEAREIEAEMTGKMGDPYAGA